MEIDRYGEVEFEKFEIQKQNTTLAKNKYYLPELSILAFNGLFPSQTCHRFLLLISVCFILRRGISLFNVFGVISFFRT